MVGKRKDVVRVDKVVGVTDIYDAEALIRMGVEEMKGSVCWGHT